MKTRKNVLWSPCFFAISLSLLPGSIALRGAAAAAADRSPPGKYTRYRMVLNEAGEDGEPLVLNLHARDAKLSTGWASAGYETGFIRTHELRREGNLLGGRLAVDVGPLQYVCELTARAAGNEIVGDYVGRRGIVGAIDGISGAAEGKLWPRAEGKDLQVELHLWSMYTEFGHIRKPSVEATVREGKITGGKFYFGRKPENRGKLEGGTLQVRNGRLTGEIRATVLAGDASPGTFMFAVDVPVRSNFVLGTYDTTKDNNNWGTHGMTGEVHGLGDSGDDGVLVLALDGGIEGERPLTLYLERHLDRFTGGMARGGNNEFHEVNASQLLLDGRTLAGPVGVTVRPSEDFPPGGRAVECEYSVKAAIKDRKAVGKFTGRYGVQEPIMGPLHGQIISTRRSQTGDGRRDRVAHPDAHRVYPPDQTEQIGWPSLAGPYGTFLPVRTNVPLVDDLSQATIAWVSENADLGIGKQGTPFHKSFRSGVTVQKYLGPDAGRHPGNWAGMIAANGKVFAASFRPSGPWFECDLPDGTPAKVRVDAEDIVVAMDFHTGHTLWVAGDTLVVPLFVRGTLRGLDVATGRARWVAPSVGSHLATPSIWRHGSRDYVLTANTSGEMRLLNPEDGKELWKVNGLGGSYFTLSPSDTHVLVNVNPKSGKAPKGDRIHGFFGAYRITPTQATLAWKMPPDLRNGIACWMDTEARYRYAMRDELAYLYTDGSGREVPGRFMVLRQDSGRIVAEHTNEGDQSNKIGGLWYLMGEKIISRWDAAHGPRHGGRHPWLLWRVSDRRITKLPGLLDKNEFTNGYEVNMEHPVVAGFLLERNEEGRVVCYDLRKGSS